MAYPTFDAEGGSDKILQMVDVANDSHALAAIETAVANSNQHGWLGIATHVEGNAVLSPGGFTVSAAPLVLIGGDDGTNILPLQLDATNKELIVHQATHDRLNLNANLQIANADVGAGNTVPISDAGGSITVDGGVKDAGIDWTAVEKYAEYTSQQTDAILWNPGAGLKVVVTDVIITISGTAVDVHLEHGTTIFAKLYGDIRGGLTHHYRTPPAAATDENITVTSSGAGTFSVELHGYEA